MPTVTQVRDALGEAITNGCGVRSYPRLTDQFAIPCAVVSRREMDPRLVFGQSKATYPFRVRVIVGRTAEKSAQKKLDELSELTGSDSIVAAIQTSGNWNVDVDYAQVTLIGEPAVGVYAEDEYIVVDYEVEVVF